MVRVDVPCGVTVGGRLKAGAGVAPPPHPETWSRVRRKSRQTEAAKVNRAVRRFLHASSNKRRTTKNDMIIKSSGEAGLNPGLLIAGIRSELPLVLTLMVSGTGFAFAICAAGAEQFAANGAPAQAME